MLLSAVVLAAALSLGSFPLVLTDGSMLRVEAAPRVKDGLAVARLEDGTLISLPAGRIDWEATARRSQAEADAAERRRRQDHAAQGEDTASGARREPTGRTPNRSPVITNQTIDSYAIEQPPGEVPAASGTGSLTQLDGPVEPLPPQVRRAPPRDDEGNGPVYWRERARALRNRTREAERQLESARRSLADEERALLYGRVTSSGGVEVRRYAQSEDELAIMQLRISLLREKVVDALVAADEAQEREAELRDEARLAGADPGWLRLPVTYR